MTVKLPSLALFSLAFVALSSGAFAQDAKGDIGYCMLQSSGLSFENSSNIAEDGHLGGFRFDVNSLFDAGVCTGRPPAFRSTDWRLCNFKGLPASENAVSSTDELLHDPEAQTLYLRAILDKIKYKYASFMKLQRIKEFSNQPHGAQAVAATIYKKGYKAVEFYALFGAPTVDSKNITIESYIQTFKDCQSSNKNPVSEKTSYPALVSESVKFAWTPPADDKKTAELLDLYVKSSKDPAPKTTDDYKSIQNGDYMYAQVDINGNKIPETAIFILREGGRRQLSDPYVVIFDSGVSQQSFMARGLMYSKYGLVIDGYISNEK